jgi:hypothetical protein
MAGMGQHSADAAAEAAGNPLRRAYYAAWAVFLGMAATSMAFQVYHAVTRGHMPSPLAALYGIVPLGVSVGVLEVAAAWQSKMAKAAAWLVTAGAMYLSATATGAVSASAAPSHADLLFGAVLDGAALIAARFILDGPSASQAVAAVARKIAELTAEADAERAAREEAEAAHRAEAAALRVRAEAAVSGLRAELAAASEAAEARITEAARVHQAAVGVLEDRVNAARESAQAAAVSAREDALAALSIAQAGAAEALARAEAAERKLAALSAREERRKTAVSDRPGSGDAPDGDPTNELRAVMELRADLELCRPRMGGELARRLGLSPATGRRLHGALTENGALSEYAQSLTRSLGDRLP